MYGLGVDGDAMKVNRSAGSLVDAEEFRGFVGGREELVEDALVADAEQVAD